MHNFYIIFYTLLFSHIFDKKANFMYNSFDKSF